MICRLSVFLIALLFIAVAADTAAVASGDDSPFAIIRASLDDSGSWEIHHFTSLPGEGPPSSFKIPAGAIGVGSSALDYALFRARHTLDFEGALREGLADEFRRRDRIKRAAHWGTYLYCAPFWPIHLSWELPLSGIEKERMLAPGGYTIHFPIIEGGSVGEIPLSISESSSEQAGSVSQSYEIKHPHTEQAEPEDWHGAGLYISYHLTSGGPEAVSGEVAIDGLFTGWPEAHSGTLLLLLDAPSDTILRIQSGPGNKPMSFSRHPGRYEWPLATAIHVFSGDRVFIGLRRVKVSGNESVRFSTSPAMGKLPEVGDNSISEMRTVWPATGSIISEHPFPSMLIPGAVISLILFHIISLIGLRIRYGRDLAGAIYDPIIAHACLLAFATVLVTFYGLGWILGAYVAGRYLKWRHPQARRPWFMMAAYALSAGAVYEVIFALPLWI